MWFCGYCARVVLAAGNWALTDLFRPADCLEDIDSIPVYGYQVTYYNEPVWIPYPEESSSRDALGKRPEGRSFHHGRFIQKLRAAAMKTPNVTVVETTVTDVVRNGWTGQVLGVECEARKEKDYVSCFLCCWSFYETVVLLPFVIMNLCLTPELECQGWVSPTPVAP